MVKRDRALFDFLPTPVIEADEGFRILYANGPALELFGYTRPEMENGLSLAVEQNLGIIAMKVMGQDQIVGKYDRFDYATCLRYALSLPITSATVGMPKREHLAANLEVVRKFKPYGEEEMEKIKAEAGREIKTSFAEFIAGHDDVA